MRMRQGTITRVIGGKRMRTDSIRGSIRPIKVGTPLVCYGEPLDPGYECRELTTSPIVAICYAGDKTTVHTESGSAYRVEFDE